jgi:hypothetical protein
VIRSANRECDETVPLRRESLGVVDVRPPRRLTGADRHGREQQRKHDQHRTGASFIGVLNEQALNSEFFSSKP